MAAPTPQQKPPAQPAAAQPSATQPQTAKPPVQPPPSAKPITTVDAFKSDLKKMEPEFAMVLPSHIPAEKFIRTLQTAAQTEPKLAAADRRLLWGEVMKCAQDGLLPDGREAIISVYNMKGVLTPKYSPMVAGICKRARNSGEIATIDAKVVHEHDTYDAWVDEKGQHFLHRPAKGDRGKPILTYGYAITKDGGFYFEEVSETQMDAIEKISRAEYGPWKGPFKDEMRRKSAIRRLGKYRLPNSSDIDPLLHRDDIPDAEEVEPEPAQKPAKATSSRLEKAIEAESVPQPEPTPEQPVVDVGEDPGPAEEPPI